MKTIILVLIVLATGFSYGQVDCKPYVPTEKGTKWEITNYSAKGKVTGKTAFELIDKVETGNTLSFEVKATSFDKKDKQTYVNTFQANCIDGKFSIDMTFMMDGEAMQAYESMDVDVDATEFEIPSMDAAPGTSLEDGSLIVKVGSGSATVFQMTVSVTDRKLVSKGNMKTPAGTFHCIELSQKVNTKMIVKIEATSREWYSPEVGMVRSESYNKNGKITGYSELTKFEKP